MCILDHSVHTTRLWAQTETKRLANSWNVLSFFAITQCQINNCLLQLNELRLTDHSAEIMKGGLAEHTNVCANMRAKLVSEVEDNIKKLKVSLIAYFYESEYVVYIRIFVFIMYAFDCHL